MPVPHLFVERDTLLCQQACCHKVPLAKGQLAKEALGRRNPLLKAHLSRERETFLEQGANSRLVTLSIKERLCQLREDVSDASLISELSMHCQALFVQDTRTGVLTSATGH